MDSQSRNSIIKISLAFITGIIIGIIMLVKDLPWYCMIIAPLYCVGFVYGIVKVGPSMLKFLGSMLKAAGSLFLFRLFFWIVLIVLLIPVGLAFLLAVCWLIGFPLAIVDLIKAIRGIGSMPGSRVMSGDDPEDEGEDDDYNYDGNSGYDDDY